MAHIHELYDFTVGAAIVYDNKVLLINHPRYGNRWFGPGGHIELDEDPEQALYREIKEEAGLEPEDIEVLSTKPEIKNADKNTKSLLVPNYMEAHDANPPHRHIGLVYFVKAKHGNFTKSDEHSDARWFTAEELDDEKFDIPASIRFFCKEALKAARP